MDSIITATSSLSVDEAVEAIKEATVANGFGVVGFHNLNQTMAEKGVECPIETRIVEVCNPKVAAGMSGMAAMVSSAMPCRISVYDQDGQTMLACISTHSLLGLFPMPAEMKGQAVVFANEVQDVLNRIMTAATA